MDLEPAAQKPTEPQAGLSTTAKVLIGLGSLIAVALIVLAVCMIMKKRAKGEEVAPPQAKPEVKPEADIEAGANPPADNQN